MNKPNVELILGGRARMPHEIVDKHIHDFSDLGYTLRPGLTQVRRHPTYRTGTIVEIHMESPTGHKKAELAFPYGLNKRNKEYELKVWDTKYSEHSGDHLDALHKQLGDLNGTV